MDYEDSVDLDSLLVFMLKNTVRNQHDQDVLGAIFSEKKESGWNDNLKDRLKSHIKSLVPEGDYCYSYDQSSLNSKNIIPRTIPCPFWDSNDEYDEQESGYCHLLQRGDWENNESKVYVNCRTGKQQTANEIGLPLSLLWDQCKECNINPERRIDD